MIRYWVSMIIMVGSIAYGGSESLPSSRIHHFEIRQCSNQLCFEANADFAYVSMAKDSLSGKQMRLRFFSRGPQTQQVHYCDRFRYSLTTQLLVCDNQDRGTVSVTVDSTLRISNFELRN